MAIRPKDSQAALAGVAAIPHLYPICEELTAAVQEWRVGAKMHLARNESSNAQQPPCELTMRRLSLSIGG
jgi:hypothetical protein